MFKKTTIIGVVVAIFSVTALASSAQAQAPRESITLSPVDKHYSVDAGSSTNDVLSVINDGATDYSFTVYARPYSVKDEAYTPDFNKTTENTDVYQWVSLPQTTYTLKAGESKEVPFTLDIPSTARPGGHYGVVFVETQPSGTDQGTSVRRNKRVGSIIYATVKGDFTERGQLSNPSTKFWQVAPPLTSTARVTNEGTTDFSDKTKMTVYDIFGQKKFEVERSYPVLPQTSRNISLQWQDVGFFGVYRVSVQHSFLTTKKDQSNFVLIMPRYVPFIIGLVLLLGIVYAVFRRKRRA